jgi:hypothetical protein
VNPVPFLNKIHKIGGGGKSDGSRSQNVALGQSLAAARGLTGKQWDALASLWQRESGWNSKAENKISGAYGIPQALPGSKMASVGKDWRTNPRTQILWGLNYIANRYGDPAKAWMMWQLRSPHWYHSGGLAGLSSNEVPSVLQRGELVVNKQNTPALLTLVDRLNNMNLSTDNTVNIEMNLYGPDGQKTTVRETGRMDKDNTIRITRRM